MRKMSTSAEGLIANVDRLLTLNTKDFTPDVAQQSGLLIQTPGEFITAVRNLIGTNL